MPQTHADQTTGLSETTPLLAGETSPRLESHSRRDSLVLAVEAAARSRTNSHSRALSQTRTNSHTHAPTSLPFRQMFMICLVTFVEPVQFGILFPFVYFMVRDFGVAGDDRDLGFYVGMLASSFCIAQLFTSLPWGWMSDRAGRRPVILIGLVGNAITCALFGMSETYTFALVMRTLCGLLNGNIGVIKSMLGEITDATNRGIAFAYWESAFGIGTIVGPILGGFLVDPVGQFPGIFGGCELLRKFPYLFPCLVSSAISLLGALIGYWYLAETLKRPQLEKRMSWLDASSAPRRLSELDLLLPETLDIEFPETVPEEDGGAGETPGASGCNGGRGSQARSSEATLAGPNGGVAGSGTAPVSALQTHARMHTGDTPNSALSPAASPARAAATSQQSVSRRARPQPRIADVLTPNVVLCIASYAVWSFLQVLYEEIYALFVATPVSAGGLGFTSFEMGIVLSLVGVIQVIGQLVLYPMAEHKWGYVGTFRVASAIMIVFSVLLPFVGDLAQALTGQHGGSGAIGVTPGPHFPGTVFIGGGDGGGFGHGSGPGGNVTIEPVYSPEQKAWVFGALMFVLAGRNVGCVIGFIAVMILVNDSAPGQHTLGTVHGFGQLAASFVRSVGPALGGTLWSWSLSNGLAFPFDFHFTLFMTAVIAVASFVISYFARHGPDAGAGSERGQREDASTDALAA
ncbi:hypothetical protein HK105_208044 [Polyrhizophydium stewartii]|uniref:Major facilitator superfamily (MFS) profile domain-containing protein n=1 Tax=Polyrhizophydium stewartii TaxID=2732419 RepID=A0ABR4MYW0_9FUNG